MINIIDTVNMKCSNSYWEDLFSCEEIDFIKNKYSQHELSDSTIGHDAIDVTVRNSKNLFINKNNETDWIFQKLDLAVAKLNSNFFRFDLYGVNFLQFTQYSNNNEYKWHWDMYSDGEGSNLNIKENEYIYNQRKLSAVLQLSDPSEYDGGTLQLAPCGNVIEVERKKGLLTVFPSFVNHCVTPVTKGTRYSIVAWYTGPNWR